MAQYSYDFNRNYHGVRHVSDKSPTKVLKELRRFLKENEEFFPISINFRGAVDEDGNFYEAELVYGSF